MYIGKLYIVDSNAISLSVYYSFAPNRFMDYLKEKKK